MIKDYNIKSVKCKS